MTMEKAFVNSFWGQKDGGFHAIQVRIKTSLRTIHELLEYYKERISIEKEYNKKLGKLASSVTLGSGEIGSLKIALDKLQNESNNMIAQNQTFIRSVSVQNYEKLYRFYQVFEKNTSKIEAHIVRVLQRKEDLKNYMENAKDKFRNACSQQKTLILLCQTTWGKELEKHTAKLQKCQQNLSSLESNYQQAVQKYTEIHEAWVRDWSIALSNIYQLEIERIQMCKLNCFAFCNNVASLCVEWDSSVDSARTTFARVGAPKDVADFVEEYGTGSQIVVPPVSVDFLNGFDEENVGGYTTANFQDPDYSHILSRTFSTHSNIVGHVTPGSPNRANSAPYIPVKPVMNKTLPAIQEPENSAAGSYAEGTADEHKDVRRAHNQKLHTPNPAPGLQKKPSHHSNYTSGTDDRHDVFDRGGSSEYSSPTNYSGNTGRSWSSPRKKSANDLQNEINRRSQDFSGSLSGSPVRKLGKNGENRGSVSLVKDFSMDFMAKALEDLNAGGDGDMNKFRRSLRPQNPQNPQNVPHNESHYDTQSVPRPASDYIEDSQETASRLDSIKFRSPKMIHNQRPVVKTVNSGNSANSANLTTIDDDSLMTVVKKTPKESKRRSISQSPTKSYTNLQAIVGKVTPVTHNTYDTKAVARYNYSAREQGELSFKKGWHMFVIHKQEDNWYVCELGDNCGEDRGSVGLVPYNYVVEGDRVF